MENQLTDVAHKKGPSLIALKDVCVDSLEHDHDHGRVIEQWDWSIHEKDFWLLAGVPGSGKSLLMATLAGLQRPSSGSISYFGREITGLQSEQWMLEKKRIGFVFEDGGRVFSELTAEDNLMMPLQYHNIGTAEERRQRVDDLLEAVEMSSMRLRYAHRLPRQWQQRLGLARALVFLPDLLMIDHPFAVLDKYQESWWLQFLTTLKDGRAFYKPKAMVVSTSDLTPWLLLGNRLALVHGGRWIETEIQPYAELKKQELFQSVLSATSSEA